MNLRMHCQIAKDTKMEKKFQKNSEIKLRLLKIQEIAFIMDLAKIAAIPDFDFKNIAIEFGFKTEIIPEKELFILNTLVKYSYLLNDKSEKIVELETTNHFEIEKLKELIDTKESDVFKVNSGILPTLIGISVSSLRGIMVVKTDGTLLSEFPLPLVNPTDICSQMINSQKKN